MPITDEDVTWENPDYMSTKQAAKRTLHHWVVTYINNNQHETCDNAGYTYAQVASVIIQSAPHKSSRDSEQMDVRLNYTDGKHKDMHFPVPPSYMKKMNDNRARKQKKQRKRREDRDDEGGAGAAATATAA